MLGGMGVPAMAAVAPRSRAPRKAVRRAGVAADSIRLRQGEHGLQLAVQTCTLLIEHRQGASVD